MRLVQYGIKVFKYHLNTNHPMTTIFWAEGCHTSCICTIHCSNTGNLSDKLSFQITTYEMHW